LGVEVEVMLMVLNHDLSEVWEELSPSKVVGEVLDWTVFYYQRMEVGRQISEMALLINLPWAAAEVLMDRA